MNFKKFFNRDSLKSVKKYTMLEIAFNMVNLDASKKDAEAVAGFLMSSWDYAVIDDDNDCPAPAVYASTLSGKNIIIECHPLVLDGVLNPVAIWEA